MAFKSIGAFLAAFLALGAGPQKHARAGEALTIRIVRPDEQGERLIGLFRGARVPHPAAALAAWKRASSGRATLGKPLEAAIAALNPAMLRELKSLDGAELRLGFVPGTGRLEWRAIVPSDDGSLAAVATALALTDGGIEPPFDGVAVLRLGPPGAALSTGRPGRLVLASTRDGLKLAIDSAREEMNGDRDLRPGWHARLDPAGLRSLKSVRGRRLFEGLDALGCREVRGWLALDDDAVTLKIASDALKPRPHGNRALDPAWVDVVPASGTLAAVSVALDTGAESLASAFAMLDRVERADPARAGLAPLRTRFNVLASAARARPEVDLWPQLNGLTAAVLVDADGQISGAIVALHALDAGAAARLSSDVLARLASAFLRVEKPEALAVDGSRTFGTVSGKPLSAATRGSRVVIGWGEGALSAALGAIEAPERSAGAALRAGWGGSAPDRAGGFWPGRLARLAPPGSPLATALNESPPIVWEGRMGGESSLDVVRWTGLRGTLRRWLDALPLDPRSDPEIPRPTR